jgi:hypothetical protein
MTAATRADAQPPRATAAECLLPVTSQAIRKHLRDRGVGAGVGPEFMSKQNSELIGKPGRKTDGAVSLEIGDGASLVKDKPAPVFVFALVFAGDGAGVAAYVPTAPGRGRGADVGS